MFFNKQKEVTITFINFRGWPNSTIPVSATHIIPEWYKQTNLRIPNEKTPTSLPTIKNCMPVFDSMTAGYILSTPCDVYVSTIDGQINLNPSMRQVIEHHSIAQAHKHPSKNDAHFYKFINSWGVKTPKGYSSLFIPPSHNPNPWFEIMPGLVDTDNYTAPVNFPFVLKDLNFEGIIPAGTPMAQIIPFKREEWSWVKGTDKDIERAGEQDRDLSRLYFHRYKKLFWTKKNWNKN
jgi:hypothetical protein